MFYGALSNSSYDVDAEITAVDAQTEARGATLEIEHLKEDIERLMLISEALWTLLKDQHGYEDEELVRRVAEIDLRDGRADGKVAARKPRDCAACHRPLSRDRRRCIYCGEEMPLDLFER